MNFSRRAEWNLPINGLTQARQSRIDRGLPIIDLTDSNPTTARLDYPEDEIGTIYDRAARNTYDPSAAGLLSAREALAATLSTADDPLSPEDLILTASTSEAYSFLFKLLADPGDNVVTAVPGYPLFDHLAALESIGLRQFALELERRWSLHAGAAADAMNDRTKAVAIVHPNNPTGSYLLQEEQDELAVLCIERNVALISDEVFLDYSFADDPRRAGCAASRQDVVSFSLGGLSKSAGLPHFKLGWIRVGGPEAERRRAIAALELIADSFLSVATPVQEALPELLVIAPRIRESIRMRTASNLSTLRSALAPLPHVRLLEPEGGWSAVIRIPRTETDEEFVLDLLERRSVLVHPGYFFDFPTDGFIVVSLLPSPDTFAEGARLLAGHLAPA